MDVEFRSIWKAIGWQRFAVVDEPGSRLLTLQFMCTLKEIEDGISFHFFRKEFTLTWKGLSTLLGFHDSCKINLQKGISRFEKNRFWEDISGAPVCKKPRTNDIHNPKLRLMHKWIAMTLFPRSDLRPIRGDELIIIFVMVRKIKISPVKCMIRQWLEIIKFSAPVECSSLITRIAKGLGVVSDQIAFISAARPRIDEAYLVQGHILKHGADGSLIYFFPGCTNEIPLPNAGYHLYNCHELAIPLQTIEESRAGGTYRETRNMKRNERESSSSSTPVQMYEAGWAPTGDAPGWTQARCPSIGVSTWVSASEDQWHAPHDIHWGDNQPSRSSGVPPSPSEWRSSSSRWDLGEITKRMDTLDVQTGEIQYNLTEHIAQTQEWQQSADA
uniref:Arabidopsis retrotransposon Orf1 C-terminal domain-containing protein n=2 Tax=Oryza sativa subsp. japonica TaxID=39947 RepID=Q53LI2_ORYSJ|nr:hypothetical protein LOC_Os11g08730 [Oryza sativa Japonica Group]AAX96064.1 hypothetical protein LOC_Os11g08890 [Oryza sativa Japonica Group]ABA91861.1 hypothetical protein LOC_Os11g08729 [Oryza sativa Japonica Group]ABA91892.1 hypothetical protein LOC_Os11g08889 [Oryza sativa Japonica Group]